MARRRVEIPLSVTQPVLVAGCERKPLGVVGIGAFTLIAMGYFGQSLMPLVIGITLLSGGLWALRKLAKADPQMFAVYARHLRYRHYHRAMQTPFRAE